MLRTCVAVSALARLVAPSLAAPAWAQKDDLVGIDAIYDGAAGGCLAAHSDKAIAQEQRLATCQAEQAATDRIYAGRKPASPHETNVYYMHRGFRSLETGGAYLKIDGARSARVCKATEAAWTDLSHFTDAGSPSAYQKDYAAMRDSIRQAVATCRTEFGTSPDAAPLPPS